MSAEKRMPKGYIAVLLGTFITMGGTFLVFLGSQSGFFIYTFGVLLLLLYYFLSIPKRDKDISPTKRRLHRIGFLGAVAMAVAAYFVYTASNLWMLLFCIGSALHAWYIFRDGVRS
ncbi:MULTISPECIES: hypothetical protein [Porphyromonas]|nr:MULTISPECIES: hypothetical protein [Porphyromonas]KGN68592.1 hypothetical protein JT26_06570 [Porphyromonas sp. COT-108 OH1349]